MKRSIPGLLLCAAIMLQLPSFGQDVPLNKFDKRGIEVINSFMFAIIEPDSQGDESIAAIAVLPYVHSSEYDANGTSLKQDRLNYSFKKAWQNARFYKVPVSVTRIQKQNITAIGFGKTAQAGTAFKVWISKKDGVAGLPAPLNVFFPSDGSAPKIYYYGSL